MAVMSAKLNKLRAKEEIRSEQPGKSNIKLALKKLMHHWNILAFYLVSFIDYMVKASRTIR